MDDSGTTEALIGAARAAMENAYAPYSGFKVGAAVLGESGRIFDGCNVENASYGLTVCAERNAIAKMVAAGDRSVKAAAISASSGEAAYPCGACRQVIAEFAAPDVRIYLATNEETVVCILSDLIPHAFKL
jgi:cytidine deaminase